MMKGFKFLRRTSKYYEGGFGSISMMLAVGVAASVVGAGIMLSGGGSRIDQSRAAKKMGRGFYDSEIAAWAGYVANNNCAHPDKNGHCSMGSTSEKGKSGNNSSSQNDVAVAQTTVQPAYLTDSGTMGYYSTSVAAGTHNCGEVVLGPDKSAEKVRSQVCIRTAPSVPVPSNIVKDVVINSAAYDGAFQVWIDYTTGIVSYKDCRSHKSGCVTKGPARDLGAMEWYDTQVEYVDGRVAHLSLFSWENGFYSFNSPVAMWGAQTFPTYLPASTFQLPGDWSKNKAAVVTLSCSPPPASENRDSDNQGAVAVYPYWVDRLAGSGATAHNVGFEVDDSDTKGTGSFKLQTEIHLSQDGVKFNSPVPLKAATWAATGCNRQPGKP